VEFLGWQGKGSGGKSSQRRPRRRVRRPLPGPDGFLFTNHAGEPIRRTRFSDVWRPAVKSSGAPAGTGFHSLRHFYASLLIRHGESVKVVQARLGHASAAETLDTYSHLWPDSEDRTRVAVDEVLGPRVSPACHAGEAGT
jgi:integrase